MGIFLVTKYGKGVPFSGWRYERGTFSGKDMRGYLFRERHEGGTFSGKDMRGVPFQGKT